MKQEFTKKVLKNGMTILFEKRDLPVVSVAFAVRCGGINEASSEKGISHFIEHMLYKGTKKRTALQVSSEIEKNGGELNGFTDELITAYWCRLPSENLNIALDVLSDIVKNSVFDPKELEKERKVIFEEIKMRRDRPNYYVLDKIQDLLYEEPLGLDLIGTEETMNSIDRKKMIDRFKRVYSPNNLVLCVVGDADLRKLVDFCEKNFGNEKGVVPNFEVKKRNEKKVESRKGIDQVNLVLAYHAPLASDKKSYAAKVLATLMGAGLSSRLFTEIREKRNLAYSIHCYPIIRKDFSYILVYAGTTKEKYEEVRDLVLKEFKKVSKELTQKEVDEAKKQLIGNWKIAMEDSREQMTHLLYSEMDGNVDEFYDFEKKINDVILEDVKELAKIKDYSFFVLVPE